MNPFRRQPPSDEELAQSATHDHKLGELLRTTTPVQHNLGWEDLNTRLQALPAPTTAPRRWLWLPAGAVVAATIAAVIAVRSRPEAPQIALETHWEMLDEIEMYDSLDALLLLANADGESP